MNRVNLALAGVVGAIAAAWAASRLESGEGWSVVDVPLLGGAVGLIDDATGALLNPDLQSMRSSSALRDMLKRREKLLLVRTDLGDGGWTIGWGRFEKLEHLLPERVTRAEADAMFEVDVDQRAERWVRAYVRVPLSQEQFDALTHMAYNLRPSSFRRIAEAVNRGEAPDATALEYVRAGSNFERGLRARRAEELALYHHGVYA
jgi:lysozyme